MNSVRPTLSRADVDELGRELDAIRDGVMKTRGEADRRYILRLIKVQRSLALAARAVLMASLAFHPSWGHALAGTAPFLSVLGLGTLMLALAKILENMEIAHNVSHAQWDWMGDAEVQSRTWEWDNVCPSEQWKHSHNVIHHTYTNVLGMDRDIGYAMLRVTDQQRWHPFYLLQPVTALVMALYFEWFFAFHDVEINRLLSGKRTWAQARPLVKQIARKSGRQMLKDYVLWPLLAGPFFLWILGANFVASVLRNCWTFAIIFCGHFPAGVFHFPKDSLAGETRGDWYVRQMLGSCNIEGGRLFHVLSGNLSHQIEHHLFPDMPSNRYQEVAPKVRALAARYGLPYNSGSFPRQLGSTLWNLLRLSLPSPSIAAAEPRPA